MYEERETKKKHIFLPALLILSFGFGSGYAVGGATDSLANKLAPPTAITDTSSTSDLPTTDTSNLVVPTAYTGSNKTLTVPEIASKAADAVVEITTEVVSSNRYYGQYVSSGAGSGVIFSTDGYIITNNHVIADANKVTVRLRNGEEYAATLVGTDAKTDIAVLKIEATNLTAATLGSSSTLQVGELAVAIGNPLGQLGGSVTDGIISALDREITLDGETMNLLQTNAAINPGNSGGGLFNNKGELIGIVVAKSAGSDIEGIGFAIPIDDVKTVTDQLLAYGYVQGRPILNMSLLDVTSLQTAARYGLSQTGVYIADLPTESNGIQSGFQVGDCITAIEKEPVATVTDIKSVLSNYKAGEQVTLQILRSGQTLSLPLVLAESKPSA